MNLETYRALLLQKRGELLGGSKPLQWTMENNSGRQGDMADQASGNNEVHIQLKLKQTDAKILQAIEDALRAGLIDEISVALCPAIDGASGAPSLFHSGEEDADMPAPLTGLTLTHHEVLPGGEIWLRYRVENDAG